MKSFKFLLTAPITGLIIIASISSKAAAATFAGTVNINTIQVCNKSRTICGQIPNAAYQIFTQKIWEQANLLINFLPSTIPANFFIPKRIILSDEFIDIDSATEFSNLVNTPGNGQDRNSDETINMWFVNSITSLAGDVQFPGEAPINFLDSDPSIAPDVHGAAYVGANGIVISNAIYSALRFDTIAHEIGHNLGLDHVNDKNNLLAPGNIRLILTTPRDIGTISLLTKDQITTAQRSEFVSAPEPNSVLGLASVLAFLRLSFKRKQIKSSV